ncbi:MAG TPA: serine O-acetyltransferase [Terrisporobacter glycolicus]|uniref:Serine acetyltransferase n=1 Tax=Terrisporobacter petrolearius TaxID=1460447 RepID=A0ABZ3FFA8_9FIRM|nr:MULTISPECIES: serine O-acetyltransferase EpsC [Terrisporobacter]MBN9645459.1 serine O-acetyltransferase [Terrisporobacter glycolicus]UPA32032.1 serine O-acetyltransferase [Terrisporobacter glycolicus]HBI91254.1 serine O-acetyltransferase [Terrisporobacter hibernicus]
MLFEHTRADINFILENDPAARSKIEVFLLYPSVHSLIMYRISHFFYTKKRFFLARAISQLSRFFTGIEIHPGAKIGMGTLIDHGSGVVIGETTIIGDRVTIYQGATIGATGNEKEFKRHPTLGDDIVVGSGAKILGPVNIGDYCKIGANSVVLRDMPSNSTAVGIPAKIKYNTSDVNKEDIDNVIYFI